MIRSAHTPEHRHLTTGSGAGLPDYDNVVEIYRSPSSLVLRAERLEDRKPVVLKGLAPECSDPLARRRLTDEFAILRSLELPGVVRAERWITSAHGPMVELEDLGRATLATLAEPLPVERVLDVALQLTTTLAAVHQRGVLHLDLSPSNVAFDPTSGRVTLLDFGSAVRIAGRVALAAGGGERGGTPGYWAPEQTGRMGGAVDRRTDFFALGGLIYRALVGVAPGPTDDLLAAVHAAVALVPASPGSLRERVGGVSAIVMKLLAKAPEDRYQGAIGLRTDLELARAQHLASGESPLFELAQSDTPEVYTPSRRLYGRQTALSELNAAFLRSRSGAKGGAVALTGPGGAGKSRLATEFGSGPALRDADLVSGKADQAGASPLAVVAGALGAAVRARMALPEQILSAMRRRVVAAVEDAGPQILDLVPGLAALSGPLQAVRDLPPAETLNRTSAALEALFFALEDAKHPLVLFLDDLQWADDASLQVIERLLLRPAGRPMLILAWRDAEVGPDHPVALLRARHPADSLHEIPVSPLGPADITTFVHDSLRCPLERAARLAAVICEKSGGNPYFATQVLDALVERGLVYLDGQANAWTWTDAQVAGVDISENVAELLAARLATLPETTKSVLATAALLGHRVSLAALAVAHGVPEDELADALAPAVAAGHVLEVGAGLSGAADVTVEAGVAFAHDRVQSAARELRTDTDRRAGALELARRLVAAADRVDLFLVADRCCDVDPGAVDTSDAPEFAGVLARAARSARVKGSPAAAMQYAERAARLLGASSWDPTATTMAEVYLEGARASVLLPGRTPEPDFIAALFRNLQDRRTRAEVHALAIDRHLARWENDAALDAAVRALAELGVRIPRRPGVLRVVKALADTSYSLWRKGDASLEALPATTDWRIAAAQELLLRPVTAAYYTSPNLLTLLILRSIDLAVAHGAGPASVSAFATYAFVQAVVMGRLDRAVFFGKLARRLAEHPDFKFFAARAEVVVVGFVDTRTGPLQGVSRRYLAIADEAMATGDWEYAVISQNNGMQFGLATGESLSELAERADQVVATCRRVGQPRWVVNARFLAQVVESLRGGTADPGAVTGSFLRFEEMEEHAAAINDRASMATSHVMRAFVRVHLGEFERAVESAALAEPNMDALPGSPQSLIYAVVASVARAWVSRSETGETRPALLRAAKRGRRALASWAKASPHNHTHHLALVDGAIAAGGGRLDLAIDHLERAARLAIERDFIHDAALAMQLAAGVASRRGHSRAAGAYFAEAIALYSRWGAVEAVRRLPGETVERRGISGPSGPLPTQRGGLDLGHVALLRAARAVASETSLDALLARLLTVLMEAVGARRGLLAMPRDGILRAVAVGETVEEQLRLRTLGLEASAPIEECLAAAEVTVNFVARTGESVLLADARSGGHVGASKTSDARSALCVPVRKGDELLAVVYLDNEILPGAFNIEHKEFAGVLASQAATALENAVLVDHLRASAATQGRLAESYGRFVPRQFLDQLAKSSILDVVPGDQVVRDFTILFADVRGFTAIAERLQAANAFRFVNTYLRYVQPAISENGGFINQFLGDGIMALFPNTPEAAVAGAVAMFQGVQNYNSERPEDFPEIRIGVGLNSGPLVLGTLGMQEGMDCGVIGDAVNLAARVEGMTKTYGAPLVISESCFRGLPPGTPWAIRELDYVVPVGRVQPIRIYEVIDAEVAGVREGKLKTLGDFERARKAFMAGRFDEALSLFSTCVATCPGDRAARMMAQRAADLRDEPVPSGWDGSHRLTVK